MQPEPKATLSRLISPAEVYRLTTLSRTTVYRRVRDGSFPPPARIGRQKMAWPEPSISAWIAAQPLAVAA